MTFRENVSGKGHPREVAFLLEAPVLPDEVPVLLSLELPIPTGCLVSTNPASRKGPPRLSAHGPHRPSGRRDVLPGRIPGTAALKSWLGVSLPGREKGAAAREAEAHGEKSCAACSEPCVCPEDSGE